MNAIFGLKINVSIGDKLIIGIAVSMRKIMIFILFFNIVFEISIFILDNVSVMLWHFKIVYPFFFFYQLDS